MRREQTARPGDRLARFAVSLEDHAVVVAALKRTRTEELGDMGYAEALRCLTESLDQEAELDRAGRRGARDLLVGLLVDRAGTAVDDTAVDRDVGPGAAPIVVVGLPASGASDLRALLGRDPRTVVPAHPLDEIDLRSMSFESRWHVPAYAEWLQAADPTSHLAWVRGALAALDPSRPAVIGSLADIERLDEVRATWPQARIVMATVEVEQAIQAAIATCVVQRQASGSRTDVDVIARYWRWRIGTMAAQLAESAALADVVVGPGDDPADVVDRVLSETA